MTKDSKIYSTAIYEIGDKYNLREPLFIVIEEDDKEVVARIPELEVYSSKGTEAEAILRLKEEVVELWEGLKDEPIERLGVLPRGWQRVLRKVIG